MKILTLTLILLAALVGSVAAQDEPVTLRESAPDPELVTLVSIADGFTTPLFVTDADDDSDRLFVLEQPGIIWIVEAGNRLGTPFLDITDRVTGAVLRGYSEEGLLGLAFHPDFAENGLFFVNYVNKNSTTVVSRFSVSADDANLADKASEEILFTLAQPYANHNGGHMEFGPDGYLYIAVGDGGAAGDILNTGQNVTDLLGSLLRIDVDTAGTGLYSAPADNPFATVDPSFAPEVWLYGVRNPWRFSFDIATGDLYIGDVGQNIWEEVNFLPADAPGGANLGWSDFESNHPFKTNTAPEGMVTPFFEYSHDGGNCSVTGGYVYRGSVLPDLVGTYLFGDYCSGRIWASYRDLDGEWQTNLFFESPLTISSFGEDAAGELYVVDYSGSVYRFEPVQ